MALTPLPTAGIMGWPIDHSLSPRLHGFWLQYYGIEGRYEAIPVNPDGFEAALQALPDRGWRGVNLTLPYKEAACTIVHHLDPLAKRIGAVNLVIVDKDGTLSGHNTDAYGFTQNLLTSGFKPLGGTAFILGAGGAARAIIVALADMGFSKISIANRTAERAKKLRQEFSLPHCPIEVIDWHDVPHALGEAEILINTTVLGMDGQAPVEFSIDALSRSATVADIVYKPLETGLLKQARQKGHQVIDGLGMLLHQARPSFAAFFGYDPDVTRELREFVLADRK